MCGGRRSRFRGKSTDSLRSVVFIADENDVVSEAGGGGAREWRWRGQPVPAVAGGGRVGTSRAGCTVMGGGVGLCG